MAERTNISFAEIQMGKELGMSLTVFGLAAGIFFLPFALSQVPIAHIASVIGARRAIVAMFIVWSICSAATSMVQNSTQLIVLRFLLGMAESGFYPTALSYLAEWFPGKVRWGRMVWDGCGGPRQSVGMGSAGYSQGVHEVCMRSPRRVAQNRCTLWGHASDDLFGWETRWGSLSDTTSQVYASSAWSTPPTTTPVHPTPPPHLTPP